MSIETEQPTMRRMADVLVVGAGPTGLFLAFLLTRQGVRVRILDEADAPATTSRALAVQARTLELYRQVGLADEVVRRGLVLGAVNLWRQGSHAARIDIRAIGEGKSPYPYALIFPQDEHERLLTERLEALGVRVERGAKLVSLDRRADGIVAHVLVADGKESTVEARFVAGCDGARSAVRGAMGVGFPGGTYEHVFYVADVEAHGPLMNRELHVLLDEAGFLGVFPLREEGRVRLVGAVRDDAARAAKLDWEQVDRRPIDRVGLQVDGVNWFSTYRVHHRVADHFRDGDVFLLGDAAHVHSPVGGQGMNTGLGDAMNLAWKLAAVISGTGKPDLLDTYEPERIAFARRLVATTDRAFKASSSEGRVAELVRTRVVPKLLPNIVKTSLGRRAFFRGLSQTGISYRPSGLSSGHAGAVHGGDRLPWVAQATPEGDDNFRPLSSLDWQVHAYGAPTDGLRAACAARGISFHAFPQSERTAAAGLQDDAVYVVRPDGYVGAVLGATHAPADLEAYLERHAVRGRG